MKGSKKMLVIIVIALTGIVMAVGVGVKEKKESKKQTDVDAGSANLTVINTVGKKLPVTGSSVMVIMLAAGTALAGFSVAKYRKDKKDEEKKQGE